MKLIILGNGYDLRNGLDTKYSDFEEWIKKTDLKKYEKINKTFNLQTGSWSNIEDQMSNSGRHIIGIVQDIVEGAHFMDEYEGSDFLEPWKNDSNIQYAAGYWIEDALISSKELNESVKDWINYINGNISKDINTKEFLKNDIKVINFNYTSYLNKRNIFHIHGASTDNEIKFGHDNVTKTSPKVNQWGNQENDGQAIMNSYNKGVSKNIESMLNFIGDDSIDVIEIIGLSLGKQDIRYIKALPNTKIIYHCYKDKNLEYVKNILKNIFEDIHFIKQ